MDDHHRGILEVVELEQSEPAWSSGSERALAQEPTPAADTFGIVAVRHNESTAAVSPTGDLDVSTSPRLLACIDELLAEGRSHITLDLRAVTFIDSSGLGALVKAHKRATPSAELTVVQPRPHIHRAMEISGILKVIRLAAPE